MLVDSVVYAVGAFAQYVLVHIAVVRIGRPRLYFVVSLQLFLLMLVADAIGLKTLGRLRGFAWVNSLMIFASLWALYMEFTFHVLRSVSIRMLVELVQSPTQMLAAQDLEQAYDTEQMFDRRIDSLVANRYVRATDGILTLTRRGSAVAWMFTIVRKLLNLRTYG